MNKTSINLHSFQWYEPFSYAEMKATGLPELNKGEVLLDGESIRIFVVDDEVISSSKFKIAASVKGEFLPFYEDKSVFVSNQGRLASVKVGDLCYIGVQPLDS